MYYMNNAYTHYTYDAYLSNVTTQNSTGLFNFEGSYNVSMFEEWDSIYYPFKDPESGKAVDKRKAAWGNHEEGQVRRDRVETSYVIEG